MQRPTKFSDCAKLFRNCKAAEKYDNIEEEEDDDEEGSTDQEKENDEFEEQTEGAGDSPSEETTSTEPETSNDVRRKRSDIKVAHFIMDRSQ